MAIVEALEGEVVGAPRRVVVTSCTKLPAKFSSTARIEPVAGGGDVKRDASGTIALRTSSSNSVCLSLK